MIAAVRAHVEEALQPLEFLWNALADVDLGLDADDVGMA